MAARYAPAAFLEILAFWFVLRWLLPAALLLLLTRLLILMMVVGTLGTLAQHHYVWATFFAAAAWLAWALLRPWRWAAPLGRARTPRLPTRLLWRRVAPSEIATLCEQRIGTRVDAAAPAMLSPTLPMEASCSRSPTTPFGCSVTTPPPPVPELDE